MLRIALIAALGALAVPTPAHACSCSAMPWNVPADGAVEVPTNLSDLHAFAAGALTLAPTLVDSTGTPVALGAPEALAGYESQERYRVPVVGALAPATTYTFELGRGGDGAPVGFTFTTGAGADLTPPAALALTELRGRYATYADGSVSSCGSEILRVHGNVTGFEPGDTIMLRVRGEGVDETRVLPAAPWALDLLGRETCAVQLALEPCTDYTIEIAARDLAGNTGPLVQQRLTVERCEDVEAGRGADACLTAGAPGVCDAVEPTPDGDDAGDGPARDGGGCSTSQPPAGAAGALLALAGLLARRARRYARAQR